MLRSSNRDLLPSFHGDDPSGKLKYRKSNMKGTLMAVIGLGVVATAAVFILSAGGLSSNSSASEQPEIMSVEATENFSGMVSLEMEAVEPNTPVIVLSTGNGLWNTGVWPGWGMGNDVVLNWAASGVRVHKTCPVKCRFTTNQKEIPNADAVVMELVNHEKFLGDQVARDTQLPFPTHLKSDALVGNFYFEPWQQFERYTTSPALKEHVDFTIAPSSDADVPVSLMCPWGVERSQFLEPAPEKLPGRNIAYFNEHGIAPKYLNFVKKFAEELGEDFHAFGHLKNREMPVEAGGDPFVLANRIKFLSTYKFHLITEFVELKDWVAGELSQTYLAGTIPIYIGAPNVMEYTPGAHSIILARDFHSPSDLVKYVKALLEDEDRYQSMFDWKKEGLSDRFNQHLDECVHYAECRICELVNERVIRPRESHTA